MGYYDVEVIVNGALEREYEPSDDGDALDKLLDEIRQGERNYAQARMMDATTVEIYVVHHAHDYGIACECAQYVTDHHAALTLRDGIEIDPR